jgi:hypothetical protein
MSENQFMIFIKNFSWALVTQRNLSEGSRNKILDQFATYLTGRLRREMEPLYLSEVANLLNTFKKFVKHRKTAVELCYAFDSCVKQSFKSETIQMRPEIAAFSFF